MIKSKFAIYAFLLIIIILFSAVGAVTLYKSQNKLDGYVKTKAVVVDYKEKIDYDVDRGYEKMYSEVVEYTVDGQKYTASNSVWTNAPKAIGKEIEIAYDPNMPSRCEFVSSSYFFPMVCFGIAGITFLVFIAQIITGIKAKNRY
ncbi:MAG: DUF3592 domain-containing protein [Clostridia bacterium]|nr:DUF3592 domain-containing protein [Clostridia bacterium]